MFTFDLDQCTVNTKTNAKLWYSELNPGYSRTWYSQSVFAEEAVAGELRATMLGEEGLY